MTDILDEILAATETARSHAHNHPPATAKLPLSVSVNTVHHLPAYFPPPFVPSPRGVQDDINPFALSYTNPTPYAFDKPPHDAPPSPPHTVDDDAQAAAAVAAAISSVTTLADTTSAPSSHFQPHKTWATPRVSTSLSTSPPAPTLTASNKRSFAHMQQTQEKRVDAIQACTQQTPAAKQVAKKVKTETKPVVMPPSAKSILERREKAIREGRRKDAKLSETERRILRRLRNRESAERCRLRRVQQACQLEEKIECMQIENDRLCALAEDYEKTIKRLEKVIHDFSKQRGA